MSPISLALFTVVYMWMAYTWFIYTDSLERPPIWRTAVQIVLLVVFASMTSSPVLLLAFVLVSGLLHFNVNVWEPAHSGVVAGAIAASILTLHGMSLGYTPVEWVTGSGRVQTYAAAGIAMAAGTAATEWKGHPIQAVLVTAGLRVPENRVEPSANLPYGAASSLPRDDEASHEEPRDDSSGGEASAERSSQVDREAADAPDSGESATKPRNHNHSVEPADREEQAERGEEQPTSEESPSVGDGQRAGDRGDEPDTGGETSSEASGESDTMLAEVLDGETDEDIEEESELTSLAYPWEEPPDLQFADIGGYNDVKEELTSQVIKPLRSNSESYARFDVQPSRGLLFHGPPGTGKTLFARALANALDRPFVELTQADLTHEHINKSPQLIKQLFEEAQALGGVIFIDEAEQLLGDRSTSENAHAEDQKVTNMFLSALTQEEQDFILLLTTNQRDAMDEAILRPGRVDNEFEIGLPDANARTKILKLTVLGVPHKLTEGHVKRLAGKTEGWSGADLDALSNKAKLEAAERGASHLKWTDIKAAYREIVQDDAE